MTGRALPIGALVAGLLALGGCGGGDEGSETDSERPSDFVQLEPPALTYDLEIEGSAPKDTAFFVTVSREDGTEICESPNPNLRVALGGACELRRPGAFVLRGLERACEGPCPQGSKLRHADLGPPANECEQGFEATDDELTTSRITVRAGRPCEIEIPAPEESG
jgi:hypothetical protein